MQLIVLTDRSTFNKSSIHAGKEASVSLKLTLDANIAANQLDALLGKGVSETDPNINVPGTTAYAKFHAAKFLADSLSTQISNQRDLPAVANSYAAQVICSGADHPLTLKDLLTQPAKMPQARPSYSSFLSRRILKPLSAGGNITYDLQVCTSRN